MSNVNLLNLVLPNIPGSIDAEAVCQLHSIGPGKSSKDSEASSGSTGHEQQAHSRESNLDVLR